MPIFEYECTECGEMVEHLQLSSDAPLAACPKCSGPVRKRVSAPAFQFKGSGWYVTDYGGKGKSAGDEGSKGNGIGDAGKDSPSADASAKSGDSGDAKASAPKKDSAKASSPSD